MEAKFTNEVQHRYKPELRGKRYDQLDLDDRIEISRLHAAGKSRREIGHLMGRDTYTADGPVACRERLGGLLKYYYQEAA